MKLWKLICAVVILMAWASQVEAFTLTFDGIPQGWDSLIDYGRQYSIGFDRGFYVTDHTASSWGPPHSGNNVLAWNFDGWTNKYGMMFKGHSGPFAANSVGGYFSTEPGVVIEMIGYRYTLENQVASVLIGDTEHSWTNGYAEISSTVGISMVEFRPVTTDALAHFCVDDLTIVPVPEPSSFIALGAGLIPLGMTLGRRRRKG